MPSRTTAALVVLLLASLALNVRLLTRRAAPPPAVAPCPSCAPAVVAVTPRAEPAGCESRLDACQRQGWDLVVKSIAADRAPRQAGAAPSGALASAPAAQSAALCAKAEASLRETWQRDREKLAAGLVQSLGDREEQERNVAREVARMRDTVGLGDRETAALEAAYRERRLARVAAARAALMRDPRVLGALLEEARGLFADEDALLAKAGGPQARDTWRAEQVEGRTVLLAIAAAMADRDWEDAIRW
jgi:hypothetical protein